MSHSDPTALLTQEVAFQKRLREVLLLFSRGVSATLSLPATLDLLARDLPPMLDGTRAAIWLHDRRARVLSLAGATDPALADAQVPSDDRVHAAARGLRLREPELADGRIVIPLRGWRRALGTLVVDGLNPGLSDAQRLEFAHELGRQLSGAIENVQLLGETIRQHRLLEDTFNSLVDLVAVVDRDLRIVQTNDAFAARVGLARDELIQRKIETLVGPAIVASLSATDVSQAPLPSSAGPVEDASLGGTFLLTVTPLINQQAQEVGRVLVARDITRQTRLERERAALRERLAQSEKLASLGQFVAGIAHEMNNPLQGVLGHLELLIEVTDAARPVRRELKQIYQDADRAAKIVRNLLVFTGSRKMARRRLQLDRIVARAITSRRASMQRAGIDVIRTPGARLPPVLGDPLLLQQALLNVIINAEHAIATGADGPRRIEVSTATDDRREHVSVTIRDSGPGLPPDVLPRIFDPFFTTKGVGQGTGLGLAITYGIVQEHGGTITATNSPEGGAVFRIELPAAKVVVE